MGRVRNWSRKEIGCPDRLTNAIAEQYFGAFGGEGAYGLPVFVAGAILGENAAKISSFYEEAGEFLTRVVGLRYGDAVKSLMNSRRGMKFSSSGNKRTRTIPRLCGLSRRRGRTWASSEGPSLTSWSPGSKAALRCAPKWSWC